MRKFDVKTQLHFITRSPLSLPPTRDRLRILFADFNLKKKKSLKPLLQRERYVIFLRAGENLKTLKSFSAAVEKLDQIAGTWPKSLIEIVSVGGGSVGDFIGFLASVYKRGVSLSHVPTTWLSAMDSAHGGKTALNLLGNKNQIGTFYPAEKIYLNRSVLFEQPEARAQEALGEVLKTAFLFPKLLPLIGGNSAEDLWRALPQLIAAKMQIVNQDPFETLGSRQFLNLGHTFGHVLEAELALSHGEAISQGLIFMLRLSEAQGLLSLEKTQTALGILKAFGISPISVRLSHKKLAQRLLRDKKNQNLNLIRFVLLKNLGKPVLKNVSLDQVLKTAEKLGWLKVDSKYV